MKSKRLCWTVRVDTRHEVFDPGDQKNVKHPGEDGGLTSILGSPGSTAN